MKVSAYILALSMVAGAADAQSMIGQLCGQDHVNQTAALGDVMSNPDGYYVRSLQTQLSHGDLRIVQAVETSFHLCMCRQERPTPAIRHHFTMLRRGPPLRPFVHSAAFFLLKRRSADFPDIHFCSFADAAFVRMRSTVTAAVPRMSPKQSLKTPN